MSKLIELTDDVLRGFVSGTNLQFYKDVFWRRVGQPRYGGVDMWLNDGKGTLPKSDLIHVGRLTLDSNVADQPYRLEDLAVMDNNGIFQNIRLNGNGNKNITFEAIFYFPQGSFLLGNLTFEGLVFVL